MSITFTYHPHPASPLRGEGHREAGGALKTLIRNIGQIVSGDIAQPLLDGDSIAIADGKIAAIGRGLDGRRRHRHRRPGHAPCVPGLIDSHCHPVFGDFTPRQRTDGLHRLRPQRRRHDHDLGRRGAPARAAQGHRRAQGARHRRRQGLRQRPARRREGARRRARSSSSGMDEEDFAEMARPASSWSARSGSAR